MSSRMDELHQLSIPLMTVPAGGFLPHDRLAASSYNDRLAILPEAVQLMRVNIRLP
jgi:hypothetical protein